MTEQKFTVQDGYLIEENRKTLYIDDAVALLSGRGQARVTTAQRQGDRAVIVSHQITCPHCRKSLPAYGRYLHDMFHTFHDYVTKKISRDTLEAWSGAQACLWPDAEDTLEFNSVYSPPGVYFCPHCHHGSAPARGANEIQITEKGSKVTISCICTDILELMKIPWKVQPITHVEFPFRESVTFHFATGKTYISASGSRGNIFAVRNISTPGDWKKSKIYQLLNHNTLVRRRMVQSFRRQWNCALPFTARELTPDLFVRLTAFVGYPVGFYDRIPAAAEHYGSEKSFRSIAKRIHTAQQLRTEIARRQLPHSKSLQKLLYSRPDLGFYLPEIELLSGWFGDVNLLRSALSRSFTYPLLAFLHMYRSADTGAFFADFIRLKGPRSLMDRLERKHEEVLLYALQYSALSASGRNAEKKKWTAAKKIYCVLDVPYSLPMQYSQIPDVRIDNFDFHQLLLKSEFLSAGTALQNCLGGWSSSDNPVFVIRHGQTIIGAIEVDRQNRIIQARGKNNLPLPESCKSAYEKWRHRFRLTEPDELSEEEDEEEDYAFNTSAYLNHLCF